jgi:dihydroxy-acid dehydratase
MMIPSEINIATKTMTLQISEALIATRKKEWKQPILKATKGVLYKYAHSVKDAAAGCVTDEAL